MPRVENGVGDVVERKRYGREGMRPTVGQGCNLSDSEGETRDDTSVPFWQVWDEFFRTFVSLGFYLLGASAKLIFNNFLHS